MATMRRHRASKQRRLPTVGRGVPAGFNSNADLPFQLASYLQPSAFSGSSMMDLSAAGDWTAPEGYNWRGGCYSFDGVNDVVSVPAASGDISSVSAQDESGALIVMSFAFSVDHYDIETPSAGKAWNIKCWATGVTPTDDERTATTLTDSGGQANLFAWYKSDERDGTISYDSSGNANDGTITNATLSSFHGDQNEYNFFSEFGGTITGGVYIPRDESSVTDDVNGDALQYSGRVKYDADLTESHCGDFDGINDYVNCGNSSAMDWTDSLSVSVKAKNDNAAISSSSTLVAKYSSSGSNREWWFLIGTDEKIQLGIGSSNGSTIAGTVKSDAAVLPGQVNTYGFTYDAGAVKFYVNGALVASTVTSGTVPATLFNGGANLTVGARGNPASFWSGQLFDAVIEKDVLTDAQMLAIHNGTFDYSLLDDFHYPIAESADTTIYNAARNGDHATLTNATATSFWSTTQDHFPYNLLYGFRYSAPAELVTNGSFATDTSWTKGSGWSISSGVASADGSQFSDSDLEQDIGLVATTEYKVTYTITSIMGSVSVRLGSAAGTSRSATGTYTETITASGDSSIRFRVSAMEAVSIDDVSVVLADSTEAKVPALSDGSTAANGLAVTNPSGDWHNNAETKVKFPPAPGMIAADEDSFMFDGSNNSNNVEYSDIVANVNNANKILADVGTTNKRKTLLVHSQALTGDALAAAKKRTGQ